jgi:hypothetical protein
VSCRSERARGGGAICNFSRNPPPVRFRRRVTKEIHVYGARMTSPPPACVQEPPELDGRPRSLRVWGCSTTHGR